MYNKTEVYNGILLTINKILFFLNILILVHTHINNELFKILFIIGAIDFGVLTVFLVDIKRKI